MQLHRQIRIPRFAKLLMSVAVVAIAPSPLIAAEPNAKNLDNADVKNSDADEFTAFIAQQEKAIEAARKRLLRGIDKQAISIRRSNLDTIAKQFSLERIAQDRSAFDKTGRLPSSDELLGPVLAFTEDFQKVFLRIKKERAIWSGQESLRFDAAALDKLNSLETRVNALLGNPERLTANSVWAGNRWGDSGSVQLRLDVKERSGNAFRGVLAQTGQFGRSDLMKVDGMLDGNRIAFHTTEMIRGDARRFDFRGYLLNDRIIAVLNGISTKREPFTASASLWRDSAARTK